MKLNTHLLLDDDDQLDDESHFHKSLSTYKMVITTFIFNVQAMVYNTLQWCIHFQYYYLLHETTCCFTDDCIITVRIFRSDGTLTHCALAYQ